tara:strand:+ start:250 stop:681 length:432 start_codon:yes stop_codon:yes gene_type:complete
MRNFKAEIQKQIDTLQNKVDVLNQKYTPEQIKDECDYITKTFTDIFDTADISKRKHKTDLIGYEMNIEEIKMLKESLELDLIEVTKRYLVTNAKELVSPSGFHPSDRVFIQPKLALQVNNLKNVPATNVQLHAFDMQGKAYSI